MLAVWFGGFVSFNRDPSAKPCTVALPVLIRLTGYGTGSLLRPLQDEKPACFRNAVVLERLRRIWVQALAVTLVKTS